MSLATNVQDLATRSGTEAKALRTLINGNVPDLSSLTTSAKGNLVVAINEIAAAAASASGIDDSGTSGATAWSSTKTRTEIDAAAAAILDSAPGVLDTLNELAAALGDDPDFAATTAAALANRVRFDAAQTITAPQAAQARSNIGAASATEVGALADGAAVSAFNAALA